MCRNSEFTRSAARCHPTGAAELRFLLNGDSAIPATRSPSLIWMVTDISGEKWADKQRIRTHQKPASSDGPIKGDLQMSLNTREIPSCCNLGICKLNRLAVGNLPFAQLFGHAILTDRPSVSPAAIWGGLPHQLILAMRSLGDRPRALRGRRDQLDCSGRGLLERSRPESCGWGRDFRLAPDGR